ncbi:hypothetical protein HELRODRAFT_178803 [Helobdella robusta]|uniref:Uncharacterized protein n=1 Tax=Helobdella robusta TaxID=6412 RepID=T1FDR5_HELRO|nr:hypothetical protein HELRODRAFT_178803 [Helobdella robusta]ESN95888.1 hypothetical protein HELRODRAFT_178803 [Helobdella robusta]
MQVFKNAITFLYLLRLVLVNLAVNALVNVLVSFMDLKQRNEPAPKILSYVKSELISYAENTTIRGLPRFVKSKDPFLKAIWLMFLLTCTTALTAFLYFAAVKFASWPILTKYGEMVDGWIKFPDVTICNLDTFAFGYPDILPIQLYFFLLLKNKMTILQQMVKNKNFSELQAQKLFDELHSVPGYILNLPKNSDVNRDCPGFILQCSIHLGNWPDDSIDCLNSFEKHWNSNYYTCYTLRTSKLQLSSTNTSVKGLNLVLNVGPPNLFQIPYLHSFTRSQARGVQVNVHSSGTPASLKNGFSVAPGTENIVTIVQTEKQRLNKPYHKEGCTHETSLKVSPNERYTRDSCVDFCKQENILKNCGCVSPYLGVPLSYVHTTDMCGNFSLNHSLILQNKFDVSLLNKNVYDNFRCSEKYLKGFCNYNCLNPCDETLYETYLSTAAWPQYSFQFGFFEKYIYKMNCTKTNSGVAARYEYYTNILERFYQLGDVYSELSSINVNESELKQIQESFLTIKFLIKEDFPYYSMEQGAYTWDTVVGVIGGMLSLWLGISAATVVELVELVVALRMNISTVDT